MRALLIILEGAGVGEAPDAAMYGDTGANTLGHTLAETGIELPALFSLGLGEILRGDVTRKGENRAGCYGRMREVSAGKDTTTGHWEIAGVRLDEPFAVFEPFPEELVKAIEKEAAVEFMGKSSGNGSAILTELGDAHLKTGRPILYASADSVLTIAAHEKVMPPSRLYEVCRVARRLSDPYRIGRVIAHPFHGEHGRFTWAPRRHDYSMVPPRTVLNAIAESGIRVEAVGKTGEIFARSGITHSHRTDSQAEGLAMIEKLWHEFHDGLIVASLGDFDSIDGLGRDVKKLAEELARFDRWLGKFLPLVENEDIIIITADRGNDPAIPGNGPTREEVPLLVKHDGLHGPLGVRKTFSDVAATLAAYFHLQTKWPLGEAFFKFNRKQGHPFNHKK